MQNYYIGMINYFKGSYQELKRVIWPSRQDTARLTLIVIAISLFVAAVLGIIDAILNYILRTFVI